MANADSSGAFSKKLFELRVVDLRQELEKRGIEKTGVKASLIERLKKALEAEGENPDEFIFEVSLSETKKKQVGAESNEEDEEEMEGCDETVTKAGENRPPTTEVVETKNGPQSNDDLDKSAGDVSTEVTESSELDSSRNMETEDKVCTTTEEEDVEATIDDELLDGDFVELIDADTNFSVDDDVLEDMGDSSSRSGEKSGETEAREKQEDTSESKQSDTSMDVAVVSKSSTEPGVPAATAAAPANKEDGIKGNKVTALLTRENLEGLEGSAERKNEDDLSLIVHVDESVNDLDNDILGTPIKACNDSSSSKEAAKEQTNTTSKPDGTSSVSPSDKSKDQNEDKSKPEMQQKSEVSSSDDSKTGDKQTTSSTGTAEKVSESKDKKDEKNSESKKGASTSSRNLWVSGLSSSTKATDLKTLFSKHGKVAGAKVVTNARSPGARCYGFITMSSPDEASKCIQHLHRTELHGRMISVERAKNDPSAQSKLAVTKKPHTNDKPSTTSTSSTSKPSDKKSGESSDKKDESKKDDRRDDRREVDRRERQRSGPIRRHSGDSRSNRSKPYRHSSDHHRNHNEPRRPPSSRPHSRHDSQGKSEKDSTKGTPTKKEENKEAAAEVSSAESDKAKEEEARKRKEEMLDFEKIKRERERERQKQIDRERREEEKRRARMLEKLERKQRDEARRLDRERERLRAEKARLEEERMEAERQRIMLERERQQRERERLEREREEERRLDAIRKREEAQRRAAKRTFESRGAREDYGGWSEPKRPTVGEPSRSDRGTESRGGDQYQRRVERYNRRDGRPIDSGNATSDAGGTRYPRRDERRDEGHRHDPPQRDNRREASGSRQSRDENVKYERQRYDDRNERRSDSGAPPLSGRDTDRRDPSRDRHDRRQASPPSHHSSRSSPPHRSQDSRTEWKDNRGSGSLSTNRDIRDSGSRYGSVASQDLNQSTSWHGSRSAMTVSTVDDRNKPRSSYNPGPGILGTVPSTVDQWQRSAAERSAAVSHPPQVHTRPPPDRAWPPVAAAPVERVPRQVAASPIINPGQVLHVPPTSSGFLASAANIMMSVGLAGNRSGQDVRYDAYKPVSSSNLRRY